MSTKHTAIIHQVLLDWTRDNRGTLWHNPQFTGSKGHRIIRAGLGTGTADIVGIEQFYDGRVQVGIWVSIEAKVYPDWLSRPQINHMKQVLDNNGLYYLALELPGCTVKTPVYWLAIVSAVEDLKRIQKEWREEWKNVNA